MVEKNATISADVESGGQPAVPAKAPEPQVDPAAVTPAGKQTPIKRSRSKAKPTPVPAAEPEPQPEPEHEPVLEPEAEQEQKPEPGPEPVPEAPKPPSKKRKARKFYPPIEHKRVVHYYKQAKAINGKTRRRVHSSGRDGDVVREDRPRYNKRNADEAYESDEPEDWNAPPDDYASESDATSDSDSASESDSGEEEEEEPRSGLKHRKVTFQKPQPRPVQMRPILQYTIV